MNAKSGILCVILVFLLSISVAVSPSQALEQTEYSLQIKITVSCLIPYQTVFPINVDVELSNIGNATFNGTLKISGKTEDGGYFAPTEYPISNLTKNAVNHFSASFRADDVGTYWFTVEIEANQSLSTIKLYQNSILKDEGFRVKTTESIFIHSFTEFIMIIGIVITIVLAVIGFIVQRKRKK